MLLQDIMSARPSLWRWLLMLLLPATPETELLHGCVPMLFLAGGIGRRRRWSYRLSGRWLKWVTI